MIRRLLLSYCYFSLISFFFFFNDTATTEIYTLSLHDALPILVDLFDPKDPTKLIRKAGEQLAGFGEMRDDGTTMGGCWIWAGCWTSSGNQMARRDNSDPTGIGNTLNWAWA